MAARLLCGIFFLSGASALVFQNLWFQQAGLAFGNSVWASSLVLAAFMGGLAIGNGLAARRRERGREALRLYAALEIVIGLTGLGLALLLPILPGLLAPLLHRLLEEPWLLNLVRFAVGFALMLVPATAMGATLPLVVTALARSSSDFGSALGRLYGWNTLGAVAGALGGEVFLNPWFGLRGTGVFAAALNLVAAAGALALARAFRPDGGPDAGGEVDTSPRRPLLPAWRLLLAAALCGGVLLALEVVWFRFLQLFVVGMSLTFAIMLAVVLLGIGLGGLVAAGWLSARPQAGRWLPVLALASAVVTILGYVRFDDALRLHGIEVTTRARDTFTLALWLMLPTCVLSGMLFTFLGLVLKERLRGEARSTGILTLANTTGAMLGALAGGFLLLPRLGVERSVFALCVLYGLVAVLVGRASPAEEARPRYRTPVVVGAWGLFGLVLALFPFGLMEKSYIARVAARFAPEGSRLIAFREGLTETVVYLRRDLLGEPLQYRLACNAIPMSATGFAGERYMKLFVHWPLALRPGARRALLISYGIGSTAEALVGARGLERIDVVDISADVLGMGDLIFPPPARPPLADPRVRVHVEDGRFFALTTSERFDLITAEPPPPRSAGIVNLYSREYFRLLHDRLTEGGITTYWLPVFDLSLPSARSLVRGFCDAFPDCSLWTGTGLNWMLAGTRGLHGPLDEEAFSAQWRDPEPAVSLRDLGFEKPEHLGAAFLADATDLRDFAGDAPPLADDFPRRLSLREPGREELDFYLSFMDADQARERFARSAYVRSLWPPALRERTLSYFAEQGIFNRSRMAALQSGTSFRLLHEALTRTSSFTLPLVVAGSEPQEQAIVDRAVARGASGSLVDYLLGLRALAARDYRRSDGLFARVAAAEPGFGEVGRFRALALCLAGDEAAAAPFLGRLRAEPTRDEEERDFWSRLEANCSRTGAPSP